MHEFGEDRWDYGNHVCAHTTVSEIKYINNNVPVICPGSMLILLLCQCQNCELNHLVDPGKYLVVDCELTVNKNLGSKCTFWPF